MADSTAFVMAVKSTIDKIANDAADVCITRAPGEPATKVIDLDNAANIQELANSQYPFILLRFMTLDESPMDPMWALEFYIGARTVSDSGNYALTTLIESFRSNVQRGADISFKDYSGAAASDNEVGYGVVVDCTIEPHIFEGVAGIRLYRVRVRCVNSVVEMVA